MLRVAAPTTAFHRRISDEMVVKQLQKIEDDPEDHAAIAEILRLWENLKPNIRTMQETCIASRLKRAAGKSEYIYIQCLVCNILFCR